MSKGKSQPQEYCPNCGKTIIEGKTFCAYCGYEKTKMPVPKKGKSTANSTCSSCGKPVAINKKYCAVCEIKKIVSIRSKSENLIPENYCPTCGDVIPLGVKICPLCYEKSKEEEIDTVKTVGTKKLLCEKCGNPVGRGKSVCSFCGYKTKRLPGSETDDKGVSSDQYCPKCGEEVEAGKEICLYCGHDINKPDEISSYDEAEKKEEAVFFIPEEHKLIVEESCKNCGQLIEENKEACPFCGYGKTKKIQDVKSEKEKIEDKIEPSSDKIEAPCEVKEDLQEKKEEILSTPYKEEDGKDSIIEEKEENKPEPISILIKIPPALLYISLAVIVLFVTGIFGIIYGFGHRSHDNHSTSRNTPSGSPTVHLSSTPLLKETTTPTHKPEPNSAEITPGQEPTVINNPVPTPTSPPVPTSVPEIIPTAIPTVIVRIYATPTQRTVYVPPDTPVPTRADYTKTSRAYCDSEITTKVIPLYNERRYNEAITECNRLITLDQNYYMNYVWMASCYLASKDTADAKYYIDMSWKLEWNEKRVPYEQSESKKLYDQYTSLGGR